MKRTAFFLVFFAFAACFGAFCQDMYSFERIEESTEQKQDETNYDNSYNDPVYDVLYNDPLLIDQQAQHEQRIEEAAAPRQPAVQEKRIEEASQRQEQREQSVPVLQPAQPMPPPAQITQPSQTAQTNQPEQTIQPVQTQTSQTQTVVAARTPQTQTQGIVPLTWELVNIIQGQSISLNDLNYYLSKSFAMIISEQYDNPKIEIKNGALFVNDQQQVSQLIFTGSQSGRLHGFPVSGSIDVFEVVFKSADKDVAMRFRRTQQNIFELYSAVIDTRPYVLHCDEGLPLLSINSNFGGGSAQDKAPSPDGAGRSRNVEGSGSLNKKAVVEYIKSQKAPLSESEIEKIVQTYFDESAFENINHDIAIAQMLYASNFLKNNQRVSGFNYSGLIELPNWDGNFSSMTEGVRAHIQHIKGYASSTLNRQQIADPRYYLLVNLKYLGTVKTFDQLYEKWTANPDNYKQNIERILNGLYQYSSK